MEQDPPQHRMLQGPLVLLGLIVFSVGVLLFPVPRITSMDRELSDLLHAPCFAVLAALCSAGRRYILPDRPILAGVTVWLVLSTVGLLTEWLQRFVTRIPSWHDVGANIAGAAAGVLWMQSRGVQKSAVRHSLMAAAISLILGASFDPAMALYEYYEQSRAMPVLASFERPRELQHWTVNESRITRTQDRAGNGASSLKLEMFPSRWPGAELRPVRDWSDYDELVFDAWLVKDDSDSAPADQSLDLIVKVADTAHNGRYDDRFHKSVRLTAGRKQTFRIPLSEIRAAPALRELNLSRIDLLQFFILNPKQPRTIWLDDIHLE